MKLTQFDWEHSSYNTQASAFLTVSDTLPEFIDLGHHS